MSSHLVHHRTVIGDPLRINPLRRGLVQNVTRVNWDSVGAIAFCHVLQGCTFAKRCFIEHARHHAPISVASERLIERKRGKENCSGNMRTLLLDVL